MLTTPALILALVGSAHAAPLFSSPFMSFDTPRNPQALAVGDLDGDGHPDVVTANADGCASTVSVSLGTGDGTLSARTGYATWAPATAVAIGDLNADGHPDVVVATVIDPDDDCAGGVAMVLLGNGDGTLQSATGFGALSSSASLAIVDLDADGQLDLAATGGPDGGVSAWFGNGDGTFGGTTNIQNDGRAGGLAIADLNADGRLDMAVTNRYAHSTSVLLGNGDGTFQARTDYSGTDYPTSVAIGDLDLDGRPDLVVGCDSADTLSVLLGNGDGTFRTTTVPGARAPAILTLADVDADGRLDLIGVGGVVTSNTRVVRVLPGTGTGAFGPEVDFFTGGQTPVGLALADLDSDGSLDLVTLSFAIAVHLGNGDGTFGAVTGTVATGEGPAAIGTADLDADGHADLAVVNAGSRSLSILLGNGDGTFDPRTDYAVGAYPRAVAIGDVDADGRPDLVVANWNNRKLSVFLGNGDGTFRVGTDVEPVYSPASVEIVDLDADGRLDLVVAAEHLGGGVSVLLGNGDGTFRPKTDYYTAANQGKSVAVGDLNQDGRWDLLVVAGDGPARVSVLIGLGDGTFMIPSDLDADSHARSAAIADFDADGRPDLVVGNASDLVSVWHGDGGGGFGARTDYPGGGSVAVADLDADGHLDLTTADGSVSLLLGNGDGTFRTYGRFGSGPFHSAATPVDLDGDGRLDLAVTNGNASAISIFMNLSGPTPPPDPPVDPTPVALAIRAFAADGRFRVEFALPQAGPARLELADVSGRMLRTIAVGELGAGVHTLDLGIDGGLRSGIYFLRLTQGANQTRARAALLK